MYCTWKTQNAENQKPWYQHWKIGLESNNWYYFMHESRALRDAWANFMSIALGIIISTVFSEHYILKPTDSMDQKIGALLIPFHNFIH